MLWTFVPVGPKRQLRCDLAFQLELTDQLSGLETLEGEDSEATDVGLADSDLGHQGASPDA